MLKKFIYFGASRLIVLGGQLLMIPVAVTQLGTAGYGLFNLMLQGAQLIRLAALQGIAQVVTRDASRLTAAHGESRLYSAALSIVVASLLLLAFVVIPLKPIIASAFHLSTGQIWLMMAMAVAVSFFGLKQVLLYNKQLGAYTVWDTVQVLGTTLSLILIGVLIPTAEAYAFAFTLVTLSVALAMRHYAGASMPRWRLIGELAIEIRRYGLPLMLGEGLGWIVAVADRFQIAAMLNLEQTGIYVAAYQLFVAPASMLGYAVAIVIQPSAFAGDTNSYRSRMEQASTLLVVLSLLYAIPALLFGKQIFAIFFRHHAEVDTALILLLVLAGLANSFLYLEIIAGKYARSPRLILVAQAGAALVILVGNWFFLPRIGIVAAAMTTFVAYVLQIVIIRALIGKDYCFRYFNMSAALAVSSKLKAGMDSALRREP